MRFRPTLSITHPCVSINLSCSVGHSLRTQTGNKQMHVHASIHGCNAHGWPPCHEMHYVELGHFASFQVVRIFAQDLYHAGCFDTFMSHTLWCLERLAILYQMLVIFRIRRTFAANADSPHHSLYKFCRSHSFDLDFILDSLINIFTHIIGA